MVMIAKNETNSWENKIKCPKVPWKVKWEASPDRKTEQTRANAY